MKRCPGPGVRRATTLTLALLAAAAAHAALPVAPPARQPAPRPILREELLAEEEPTAKDLLDRLVPLGDGPGNAADFLAALRPGGAGAGELARALERAAPLELVLDEGPALAADDPLLLAAAPWTLQARCAFFPDVVPFEGGLTWRVGDELASLLARSWVAEARATGSAEPARRAVRLGRLLLSEEAWFETSFAGQRAVLLGLNELRRQAENGGRTAETLACLRVLSRVQVRWLRGRSLARSLGAQARDAAQRAHGLAGLYPLSDLKLDAGSPNLRLLTVAEQWRAAGPEGADAASRAEAAARLGSWTRQADPVVAAAARHWSGRPWTAGATVALLPPIDDLPWDRERSGDPVERWLRLRVPSSVQALSSSPAERGRTGSVGPPPEALARPTRQAVREILARVEAWPRGAERESQALSPDDPFLLEVEAWLLAGPSALPEDSDRSVGHSRNRLLLVAWRSLMRRAAQRRGSPAAARALEAARRLLDGRELWGGFANPWALAEMKGLGSLEALALGEDEEALRRGIGAAEAVLAWWWQRELTHGVDAIEQRPLRRSLFGFGPPRAALAGADLELLRRLASERGETAVRRRAAEGLYHVSHVGSFGQRRRAKLLLAELAGDSDAELAAEASRLLDRPFTKARRDLDVELDRAAESLSEATSWLRGG